MPRRSSSSSKNQVKKDARQQWLAIGAGIIAVVLLVGALWWFNPSAAKPSSATTTLLSAPIQTNSNLLDVQQVQAIIASYPQQRSFTANYTGSVYSDITTSPQPMNTNITSSYSRYNDSAFTSTFVSSPGAESFSTAAYYSANGLTYECTANATSNYTCQRATNPFNATDFGLSIFLTAITNSSNKSIAVSNSSVDGIPCLEMSTSSNSTLNESGMTIRGTESISGCIEPRYRIPLVLNLTSLSTASGIYTNATGSTRINPISETLRVHLLLVNLTNSSSQAQVENLPANARIVSGR